MSIHKNKRGFEVRWREGARNRGRTFDRKGDAEAFQAHVRRQSQLGQEVPARIGTATLAESFARWLGTRQRLAPRTRDLYEELFERHVFDQLGYAPIASLTPERLEDWQAERLASGAGTEALAKTIKVLNQVFTRAEKEGKINRNPVRWLERPHTEHREITPATPKQIEAMREWFVRRKRPGDAVLVSVMAYGGLRFGEALALRWEDFSKGNQLWISRSLENDGTTRTTKNRLERPVTLPAAAAQDLLAWRNQSEAEGLVFPRAKDGAGWTKTDRNNWRRRFFAPAAEAAGLETFPPKNLRHSCASLMIAAGRPSTEVAEALGHSLVVSQRVYQRLLREMKDQPVRTVDEMIAEARTSGEHADEGERLKAASKTTAESEKMA